MREGEKNGSFTNIGDKIYTMDRNGHVLIIGKNLKFVSNVVAFGGLDKRNR